MDKKEEKILGLSYWVASLDGSLDVKEKEFIEKSSFLKPFYSPENFDHCKKEIAAKSKNKDTRQFVSDYLKGLEITPEESRKLVNDLCEIGASDGDFDDIEKKYIGYVVEELGLVKEKIVETFDKTNKTQKKQDTTTSSSRNLSVPKDLLFAKKEKELTPIVQTKIKNHIEKKLSIQGFDLDITDLKIRKTQKLSAHVLYDNREAQEDVEINYRGAFESRTVLKSSIDLFGSNCGGKPPARKDYEFKNLKSVTKFRVDGTNQRETCGKCLGLKKVRCVLCDGSGKRTCYSCNGAGDKDCSSCTGGEKRCWTCGGDGQKSSYDYNRKRDVTRPCSSCGARGYTPCGTCGRTGRVRCNPCRGTGEITCSTCGGRGQVPCSRCDAQGSFTYFFRIVSTLLEKENSAFIAGEPDKQYITKNLGSDEFEYSNLFGKYQFSKLEEHASELKNLFKSLKFDSHQMPKKVRFDLEDCASMSFVITVAGNVYLGGLGNDGKLFFDETILDQLFFNVIKSLNIDQTFRSIESIKNPILAQIPGFNITFEKIKQYKSLSKIVSSAEKKEKKLNDIRKLTKINTINFSKFLVSEIRKKNNIASLVVALVCYVPIWFFYPILTTIVSVLFLLNYIFTSIAVSNHLNDVKKDAQKVRSTWIRRFVIIYLFSLLIALPLGENESFYDEYLAGYNLPVFDPFELNKYGFDQAFISQEDRDNIEIEAMNAHLEKWEADLPSYNDFTYIDGYEPNIPKYETFNAYMDNEQYVRERQYFILEHKSTLFEDFKQRYNIINSKKLEEAIDSSGSPLGNKYSSIIFLKPSGKETKQKYYIKTGSNIYYQGGYRFYARERIYVDLDDYQYTDMVKRSRLSNINWRMTPTEERYKRPDNSYIDKKLIVRVEDLAKRDKIYYGFYFIENSMSGFSPIFNSSTFKSQVREEFVDFQTLKSFSDNLNLEEFINVEEAEENQIEIEMKKEEEEEKEKEREDERKAQQLAEEKRKLDEARKKQIAAEDKKRSEEVRKRLQEQASLARTKALNALQNNEKKPSTDGFQEWYSSERKSANYSKFMRDVVRQIKKEYNIKVEKVIMFRPPNVVKQENAVTGYYFNTQSEMERFKKAVSSLQNVKLYIENKQDKILYYSSPNNNKL